MRRKSTTQNIPLSVIIPLIDHILNLDKRVSPRLSDSLQHRSSIIKHNESQSGVEMYEAARCATDDWTVGVWAPRGILAVRIEALTFSVKVGWEYGVFE